jgi:hypothetical protein
MRTSLLSSRLMLTAAMSTLLMASPLLSGCSSFEKQPPRYNTVMGNKRAPILNPGGTNFTSVEPDTEAGPGVPEPLPAGMNAGMPVAPGSMAMMTNDPAMAPMMDRPLMPDNASFDEGAGRKVPMGNQQALAAERGMVDVAQTAPMIPVQSADMMAPLPSDMYSQDGQGLAMGVQPQPMETAGYQPMTNEDGEFPTLSEVPPVTRGMKDDARAARRDAAAFTQNAQSLPPLDQVSSPPVDQAPVLSEAPPSPLNPPIEQAQPASLPTYEQEVQSAYAMPPAAMSEPQPLVDSAAPTPLEQAGQTYDEYYAEPVPAMAPPPPAYSDVPSDTVYEAEPMPVETAYGAPSEYDMNYPASPSGLPPIQLRPPVSMAGSPAAVAQGRFLPASRYANRPRTGRPTVLRH